MKKVNWWIIGIVTVLTALFLFGGGMIAGGLGNRGYGLMSGYGMMGNWGYSPFSWFGMGLIPIGIVTLIVYGVGAQATLWDAPLGGHHVEGKLVFPGTKDGKSILEGATKLTLTILNVDAPTRIFEWDLK